MSQALARGPVMIDVEGLELSAGDAERLRHPAAGGVILFAENYDSPQQLKRLVASIKAVRSPELLVAVDQEGGRVQRFRDGFTRLPSGAVYGRAWDQSREYGLDLAWLGGWLMARELRDCGVDLSFAPVLDVDLCGSTVIGDRAFHGTAEGVTELAGAFIQGMAAVGMRATGKHFPGHGGVSVDSHVEMPIETRGLRELKACDMAPFAALMQSGALAAIMTAHVQYPDVDTAPPTFSSRWLKDELRGNCRFKGVIFSDDLHMGAAETAGDPAERARAALAAGCDVPLICRDPNAADSIMDAVLADAGSEGALQSTHGDPMAALLPLKSMPVSRDALAEAARVLESHAGTGKG